MNKIGEKVAEIRTKQGFTQPELAKLISDGGESVTSQKISKWETDYSIPNAYQFMSLCKALNIHDILETFGIMQNDLSKLSYEGKQKVNEYIRLLIASGFYCNEMKKAVPITRKLKLYDLPVSAGTGQFLDSDSYEFIEVGEEVPELADFGVKISGDSMEPRFVSGQIVWIHKQDILNDGEIGIFGFENNAYCKKLSLTTATTKLISLNPSYQPIVIPKDADFYVFGKVVG